MQDPKLNDRLDTQFEDMTGGDNADPVMNEHPLRKRLREQENDLTQMIQA